MDRKKIIKFIYSLLVMLMFTWAFAVNAYASSSQTGHNQGVGDGNNVLGPSVHRTGWIFYLVDIKTKRTVGQPKGITCNNEGDNYNSNDSFKEIQKYKDTKLYLATDFGMAVGINNIATGNRANYDNEMTDLSGNKKPAWGYPYAYKNPTIIGRGKPVRDWFNKETTFLGTKIRNSSLFIYLQWGMNEAERFKDGELALFFEPFYWIKEKGQPWRCGTVHSLTKHLTTKMHSMTHKAFPYGVIIETGKGIAGVTLPSKYSTPAIRNEDILTNRAYGFGMGAYWNKKVKKHGMINTYNGKDSPGNAEYPSKKEQRGKCKIVKQYWIEEREGGKVVYRKAGKSEEDESLHRFIQNKVTKRIKITEEEDKGGGYKLKGWFTRKDGGTADPEPDKVKNEVNFHSFFHS